MNDKKGLFLLKNLVSMLLSIMAMFFLAILLFILFGLFTAESDLEKMEKKLDRIINLAKYVWENGEKTNLEIFASNPWYLVSFNVGDRYPGDKCDESKSCLCFCKKEDCKSGQLVCKSIEDFSFKVYGFSNTNNIYVDEKRIRSFIIIKSNNEVGIINPESYEEGKFDVGDPKSKFKELLDSEVIVNGKGIKFLQLLQEIHDFYIDTKNSNGQNIFESGTEIDVFLGSYSGELALIHKGFSETNAKKLADYRDKRKDAIVEKLNEFYKIDKLKGRRTKGFDSGFRFFTRDSIYLEGDYVKLRGTGLLDNGGNIYPDEDYRAGNRYSGTYRGGYSFFVRLILSKELVEEAESQGIEFGDPVVVEKKGTEGPDTFSGNPRLGEYAVP